MKINYSANSRKIESISLINHSFSFKFTFSHMHFETLTVIFMLLKRKLVLKGFNSNFKIKKMLGEGACGRVNKYS